MLVDRPFVSALTLLAASAASRNPGRIIISLNPYLIGKERRELPPGCLGRRHRLSLRQTGLGESRHTQETRARPSIQALWTCDQTHGIRQVGGILQIEAQVRVVSYSNSTPRNGGD